ncbi:MAG: two-component response regulator [Candidatus Peregrinibacteria bacterium Greene0416_19]|nr:MAG: two-component response regulator [Candidatus Peregrinibacteria bacterium Greene0416_19]
MHPKKLLIAEQGKALREEYAKNFPKEWTLIFAEDGEQAIELMDRAQPDLLLSCIHMPKIDGFELLIHVREKHYAFPVVILTNFDQDDFKLRAEELGATAYYVKKDYTIKMIIPEIEKYLHPSAT